MHDNERFDSVMSALYLSHDINDLEDSIEKLRGDSSLRAQRELAELEADLEMELNSTISTMSRIRELMEYAVT